jgi:hypothetical protein
VHSIVDDAVYNFMTAAGEGDHEDILRAFFRLKVSDIGQVLSEVVNTTKRASRETGRNMATILPEANGAIYVSPSSLLTADMRAHLLVGTRTDRPELGFRLQRVQQGRVRYRVPHD